MHVRILRESDIPAIRQWFAESELPYEFPALDGPRMEAIHVVCDEDGKPLMALAAERLVQLYLWCGPNVPAAKLHGIRLLHNSMASVLKEKGYNAVECFIPPQLAKSFGRRLERTFGWIRNWPSWTRGF